MRSFDLTRQSHKRIGSIMASLVVFQDIGNANGQTTSNLLAVRGFQNRLQMKPKANVTLELSVVGLMQYHSYLAN